MAQDTVVVAQHVRTQTSKRVPRPKAKSTDSTEAIDVQVQDWNLNDPARTTSPPTATSTATFRRRRRAVRGQPQSASAASDEPAAGDGRGAAGETCRMAATEEISTQVASLQLETCHLSTDFLGRRHAAGFASRPATIARCRFVRCRRCRLWLTTYCTTSPSKRRRRGRCGRRSRTGWIVQVPVLNLNVDCLRAVC